jgi:hypothetical protein
MADEEAKVGANTMEFYRTSLPAVPLLLVGFLCGEGVELVRIPILQLTHAAFTGMALNLESENAVWFLPWAGGKGREGIPQMCVAHPLKVKQMIFLLYLVSHAVSCSCMCHVILSCVVS